MPLAMDDDLVVVVDLASLASFGITTTPSGDDGECFMQSIIFKGDAAGVGGVTATGYEPEETQSQDCQGSFTSLTYDQAGMQDTFMQGQVGLDLDGFLVDHVFLDDYDLKEEDELDNDGEPLFEDELTNQAIGEKPKRNNRQMKE
ncbi:DNA repair protein rhp54 [Hordeum vulgare]|nr:DNA repair protein rhp54 [Hordeum vulgare]